MKTRNKILLMAAGLGCLFSMQLAAQTFTVLHRFAGGDSANPVGTLTISGNRLYGTTSAFWTSGNGTVFAVNTDGTDFQTLHTFSIPTYDPDLNADTNSDGALPMAGLIVFGNRLYGTAYKGGGWGQGTVFAVNTDGTGFETLHSFDGSEDTARPWAPLLLSSNTLYGTTYGYGEGTVFALNTDGTGFAVVHHFIDGPGATPADGLVLSGNALYGTAMGTMSTGSTVFRVNTDGTGFTNLHVFSGIDGHDPANAGLTLSGNTLYGTTWLGGSAGYGTLFKLETDGTDFTSLHSFGTATNGSDGVNPCYGVILDGNTLYGTARGGLGGSGLVFAINTNGTGFTSLHNFTPLPPTPEPSTNTDGAGLQSGLLLSGNILYGIAISGGSGYGTVFSIALPPTLTITAAGTNVIVMWPTNITGLALQSTTNLLESAVWVNVSPPPVVVNGKYAVTNLIRGTRQFYRLSRP